MNTKQTGEDQNHSIWLFWAWAAAFTILTVSITLLLAFNLNARTTTFRAIKMVWAIFVYCTGLLWLTRRIKDFLETREGLKDGSEWLARVWREVYGDELEEPKKNQ
ncbi:hypothetical protein BJ508DRAFT_116321 [Ascobolus immersus RN42]|uniref:Uncharacterized protein n=1 Tax=Ascobolus immersus RN42 TaxID=1160509 RepID=A0A3N4I8U9_ASCIM|nr:hypothetical protein BJ508DRAFT_116321 [Ascobolus immersus RN42]